MKYTKKRDRFGILHAYHKGSEYRILRYRKAFKVFKVQIFKDNNCLYDSAVHSNGLGFDRSEEAKDFIEKQLISGVFDWESDVEKYQAEQAVRAAEIETRQKNEADSFLESLKSKGIGIASFLALYERFENLDSDIQCLIYQASSE